MPAFLFLGAFLFWLALHGRLGTYAGFVSTGNSTSANTPVPGSPGGLNIYGGKTSASPPPTGSAALTALGKWIDSLMGK